MHDLTGSTLSFVEIRPFDRCPQVEQQQGQRDEEQAEGDGARTGAWPHGIHQAVGTLDAKAFAVFLVNLVRWHGQVANDAVSEIANALAAIASLAVLADNPDREAFIVVDAA